MSTIKKYKSYPYEVKLDAVTKVLSGESVKSVAKLHGVVDPDYIYVWIEKYETYGEVGLKRKLRNSSSLDKDNVIRELKMENEILKKVPTHSKKGGKRTKFKVVDALKTKYPIGKICKVLNVSRSGYHKYCKINGRRKNNPSETKS
ncbi:MAG: helix-turn-helix domain-containing protein [Bacillus sp. (in: Bacteria)]|nr:helix-turn-helix domain-containing protein [Bacillus sp. (in: firmicutes)]